MLILFIDDSSFVLSCWWMWVLGLSDMIIGLVPTWSDVSAGHAFLTSRSNVSVGRTILTSKSDMLKKTYMEARPTTSMKKGWLCRTSYDEKNWDITPFAWDSKSSDDDDDPVTKTCANVLCQENTFLVKRECWCICNFGMHSLMYFIYCIWLVPMFLLGDSVM